MKVLVAGAAGMLGRAVVAEFSRRGCQVTACTRNDMDITAIETVRGKLTAARPELVINCAAYTKVDGAEEEAYQAFLVNGLGAKNLALACREHNADLVHISTDYVFDGSKEGPYGIYDGTNPINTYGRSKLWGERAVAEILPRHYIVRTSWLFGLGGRSFVETMLRLFRERSKLEVVDDQRGAPTYTVDLAGALADLVTTRCYGTYHITNQGLTSWYGFARAIAASVRSPVEIIPCSTAQFPRPARRPANSALDPFPLLETIGRLLPFWEDALARYLTKNRCE
ncbi:MAG TPA: dTDP-4-dehydrorhamnose reductase [Desulfotomaculum sp.]|nr:dTDP-4-dehydrorhamnose reductase [Desulfotomaculum sp.]